MSASDDKFTAAMAALGVNNADPFSRFWNQSDEPTRRMFLVMGRAPAYLTGSTWGELPADCRGQIKRRAVQLQAWLNKVMPCAAL